MRRCTLRVAAGAKQLPPHKELLQKLKQLQLQTAFRQDLAFKETEHYMTLSCISVSLHHYSIEGALL